MSGKGLEEKSSKDTPLWKTITCKDSAKLNTHYYTLTSLFFFFFFFLQCWGSSGKKVVFHHGLDLVFVAPFPNAMIKNNNTDNGVPSKKQWAEIPTSVLLKKMAFMRPAALPSSGYSRRSFLTHSNSNYQILNKTKRKGKTTLGPCAELIMWMEEDQVSWFNCSSIRWFIKKKNTK